MKVTTDLTDIAPEVDIDFENGTKVSIFRDTDGKLCIFVDPSTDQEVFEQVRYEYDPGYR